MASSLAPLVHACTQLSTFYDSLLAHLRVIDLIVLSQVCTLLRRYFGCQIFRTFSRRMRERLAELGWDPLADTSPFFSHLSTCESALTGSFVLQVLLGEYYPHADVDLFVVEQWERDRPVFVCFQEDTFFPPCARDRFLYEHLEQSSGLDLFPQWKHTRFGSSMKYYSVFPRELSRRLDVVLIDDRSTSIRLVLELFDFAFLANSYDGRTLRVLYPRAVVARKSHVLPRRLEMSELPRTLARISKYQVRGFSLLYESMPISLPVRIEERLAHKSPFKRRTRQLSIYLYREQVEPLLVDVPRGVLAHRALCSLGLALVDYRSLVPEQVRVQKQKREYRARVVKKRK